jgi:hypothetical protein
MRCLLRQPMSRKREVLLFEQQHQCPQSNAGAAYKSAAKLSQRAQQKRCALRHLEVMRQQHVQKRRELGNREAAGLTTERLRHGGMAPR